MKTIHTETPSPLTKHQQKIFNKIVEQIDTKVPSLLKSSRIEDYLLSLTGAAGTGKTFLTVQIAKYLAQKQQELTYPKNIDYNFVITAPTHKAVGVIAETLAHAGLEASCKTIHSFLGIKPFVDYETGEERYKIDKTKKSKDATSILMVDESSMIGSELYEFILEAIEEGRVQMVLFIGDPYQLLPVNDDVNHVYKLKQQFNLTEVVRQAKDSYIISIATKLRERIQRQDFMDLKQFFAECGQTYQELKLFHNKTDFLNAFYEGEKWHEADKVLAAYKNKNVDAFNREIRSVYWQQQNINIPSTLLPGDRLRFKEAYSIRDVTLYYNGQVVILEEAEKQYHDLLQIEFWECKAVHMPQQQIFRVVDPDSIKVFNDKLTLLAKKARESKYPDNKNYWKAFFEVRDMFAQVQYVYASTIHKLQGSTYEDVFIDLFSMVDNRYMSQDEKYRLAYVAVTRASRDVKLFMPGFNGPNHAEGLPDMYKEFDVIDSMLEDLTL